MIPTTTSEALAVASAGSTTTTYPDTDNQMEDGVFSFAKRDDEARCWNTLLDGLGHSPHSPQAGPALDVGCGLGAFVAPLRERFAEAFFIDRDAGRLQAAARHAGLTAGSDRRLNPTPNNLNNQNFSPTPSAESNGFFVLDPLAGTGAGLVGRFAFVQAIQVLGHLARADAVRMTQTLAGWLAPGGHLLLALPFTGTPFDVHVVTRYVDGMDQPRPHPVSASRFDEEARSPQPARLPVRHFSMGSIHALAADANLEVRDTRPYHWFNDTTGDLFAVLARR